MSIQYPSHISAIFPARQRHEPMEVDENEDDDDHDHNDDGE